MSPCSRVLPRPRSSGRTKEASELLAWKVARALEDSPPTRLRLSASSRRPTPSSRSFPNGVLQIEAEASVLDAVKEMVEENVGSLLVTEGGAVAGIVTERDYLRRVTLEGRSDREAAVREIISTPLIVATPETSVDECMALMTNRRIRHVPVVDRGDVVGIVSIGDLVKFRSKQQSFEIKYLTEYIGAH
jgi:CBS domain-containing protein